MQVLWFFMLFWYRSNVLFDRGENPTRRRAQNNGYSSPPVEARNHDANDRGNQGQKPICKVEVWRCTERPQYNEG
jgi:hypothetical protein